MANCSTRGTTKAVQSRLGEMWALNANYLCDINQENPEMKRFSQEMEKYGQEVLTTSHGIFNQEMHQYSDNHRYSKFDRQVFSNKPAESTNSVSESVFHNIATHVDQNYKSTEMVQPPSKYDKNTASIDNSDTLSAANILIKISTSSDAQTKHLLLTYVTSKQSHAFVSDSSASEVGVDGKTNIVEMDISRQRTRLPPLSRTEW